MIKKLALSVLMAGSTLAFAQPYRRDNRFNENDRPVVVEHRDNRFGERPVVVEHRQYRERSDGYYDRLGCWHTYDTFRR